MIMGGAIASVFWIAALPLIKRHNAPRDSSDDRD